MRVNSIAELSKHDMQRELNNKYKDKQKIKHKDQEISFADVLEQVKYNNRKSGHMKQA